jgi:hypothetical protein
VCILAILVAGTSGVSEDFSTSVKHAVALTATLGVAIAVIAIIVFAVRDERRRLQAAQETYMPMPIVTESCGRV